MNHRAFILVGVIFALLLGALVLHQGDLAWMTLPFLAYLGLGILKAPAAELVRLQATRSVKSTRHEQGKMVVTVDVALGC